MSLGDTLKNITGPLVKNLANQLGSSVTFRRATLSRSLDNSSKRTWTDLSTTKVIIENLNQFKAQQVWGIGSGVTAQALVPMSSFADDETPKARDGMVVTDGFMSGSKYTIDDTKPDDLGQNLILALVAPEDAGI